MTTTAGIKSEIDTNNWNLYLIYSENEAKENSSDGPGYLGAQIENDGRYWSAELGNWVSRDLATKFTHREHETMTLPDSLDGDAKWILWSED